MTRNSSNLNKDFTFALEAYKATGCYRELFYVKKFAQMILAGNY